MITTLSHKVHKNRNNHKYQTCKEDLPSQLEIVEEVKLALIQQQFILLYHQKYLNIRILSQPKPQPQLNSTKHILGWG